MIDGINYEVAEISPEILETFHIKSYEDIPLFLDAIRIDSIDGEETPNLSLSRFLQTRISDLKKSDYDVGKPLNNKIKGKLGAKSIELHTVKFNWKMEPHIVLKINNEELIKEKLISMKKVDKFKDQFLASITHDLRTPLFGVEVMIDSAMVENDSNEQKRLLSLAKMNTKLLLNLVNDILDYSQFKEKKFRLNLGSFNLSLMLDEVISLMGIQAGMKKLRLQCDNKCDGSLVMFSDSKRMKQVLINLISNAIKFTERGGVDVRIRPLGENLIKIEVIDTGIGIKEEHLPLLTKPYNTFDTGSGTNREGIGLGLFNCKNIINRLGPFEKLYISSRYGSGSKFGFVAYKNVPVCRQGDEMNMTSISNTKNLLTSNAYYQRYFKDLKASENLLALRSIDIQMDEPMENEDLLSPFSTYVSLVEEEEECSPKKFPDQTNQQLLTPLEVTLRDKQPHLFKKKSTLKREKKFSIMIADDNSFNILIITKFLQKLPGFKISPHVACNGKKALEIFSEVNKLGTCQPIKIIYMDCKMPVMSGFEATREIRALASNGSHYDPVIIGLTSFIGEDERDLAIQCGMNDIHLKPITESEFIEITLNYVNGLISSKSFGEDLTQAI